MSGHRSDEKNDLNLIDVFLTFWKRKWLIAGITFAFMIGSISISLLLQPEYDAKTSIIPITSNQGSALSQYAGLAALAGMSLPAGMTSTPSQKIVAILKSRSLCERVVKDLDLVPVILNTSGSIKKRDPFNVAVEKMMGSILSVDENQQTGIIVVKAEFKDQKLAMDIANHSVEVLEDILNAKNLTVSKKSIKVLEDQISEQEAKVKDLQAKMASFQKNTKIILPEGQVTSAMALYSTLLTQKLAVEVEIAKLESAFSQENPQLTEARTQLGAIDRQITKIESGTGIGTFSMDSAPEQIVEYQNIYRDLEIATKIYSGLLASYENQKLQEAQDQIFVEVIDPAIFPELKAKPRRTMITMLGTISGFLLAALVAFLFDSLRDIGTEIKTRLS